MVGDYYIPTSSNPYMQNLSYNKGNVQSTPTAKPKVKKPISIRTVSSVYDQDVNVESEIYIPSGAVFTAKLVTGVDAPTSDGAKQDPVPILAKLNSLDFMPNGHQVNLADCTLLMTGFGEISSERAQMRTQRLTCIDKQGQIYQGNIKGYAVGSDGKVGVSGRLVSKQGSIIAKGVMISTLDTVSQVIGKPSVIVAGNTNSQVNSEAVLRSAVLGSSNRAIDHLIKFYTNTASKMYPLVEVQADTQIDIVLTDGFVLEKTKYKIQSNPLNEARFPGNKAIYPGLAESNSSFQQRTSEVNDLESENSTTNYVNLNLPPIRSIKN